jgi:hypothetical protein
MSTNSEESSPSDREVARLELWVESNRVRVGYGVLHGLGVLAVVYAVNALFNIGEAIAQSGISGVSFSDGLHALQLNDLAALFTQLPAQILAILGVLSLSVILSLKFRWELKRRVSGVEGQRLFRYQEIRTWLKEDPEMVDLLALLVNRARFWRNLGIAILIPAASVVGARLLVLWHHH